MARSKVPQERAAGIERWIPPEEEEALRRWMEDPAHKQPYQGPQPQQNTENRNE